MMARMLTGVTTAKPACRQVQAPTSSDHDKLKSAPHIDVKKVKADASSPALVDVIPDHAGINRSATCPSPYLQPTR